MRDGEVGKHAHRLAVLGDEAEAGFDRALGRLPLDGLAAIRHGAGDRRIEAENPARDCGSSGADEAGEAEHFAAMQLERYAATEPHRASCPCRFRADNSNRAATLRDAPRLAQLHGASFHRGWGEGEFESMIAERNTLVHRLRLGRKTIGFAVSRIVSVSGRALKP